MSNPNPNPATRFQKGREPTGGRPKGTRDQLNKEFIAALTADFVKHGSKAIARLRVEDNASYQRIVASLQPKEVQITTPESSLTDEQLDGYYEILAARLAERAKRLEAEPPTQTVN